MDVFSYNMSFLSFHRFNTDDSLFFHNSNFFYNYLFNNRIPNSTYINCIDISKYDLALVNITDIKEDFHIIKQLLINGSDYIICFFNKNFINYNFNNFLIYDMDYVCTSYNLRLCNFGCPVKGFQYFVVFRKSNLDPLNFNAFNCTTLFDVLSGVPLLRENVSDPVLKWHYTHGLIDKFLLVHDLKQGEELDNNYNGSYYRCKLNGLVPKLNSKTLDPYYLLHPLETRSFTPYELFRILNVNDNSLPLYLKSNKKVLNDILSKCVCGNIMNSIFKEVGKHVK